MKLWRVKTAIHVKYTPITIGQGALSLHRQQQAEQEAAEAAGKAKQEGQGDRPLFELPTTKDEFLFNRTKQREPK